jgi:Fe-S cluster assembly scaffold protein SufB
LYKIVKDRAVANAVPIVNVSHPEAKVTHQAAIGSIDRRQLETLMAHGLDSEEAVRLVVDGILS